MKRTWEWSATTIAAVGAVVKLWTAARPPRALAGRYLSAVIIGGVLATAGPFLIATLVSATTSRHRQLVVLCSVALVGTSAADAVASVVERRLQVRIAEASLAHLRVRFFDAVQRCPVSQIAGIEAGGVMAKFANELALVEAALSSLIGSVAGSAVIVASSVVGLLLLDIRLAVVVLIMMPLAYIPSAILRTRVERDTVEALQAQASVVAHAAERLSARGAVLVKSFSTFEAEAREFGAVANGAAVATTRAACTQRLASVLTGLANSLGGIAIYGIGGWLAVGRGIGIGSVVGATVYANRLFLPVSALASARLELARGTVALDRVAQITEDVSRPARGTSRREQAGVGESKSRLSTGIEVRELDVRASARSHTKATFVVRGVSLDVAQGEFVAIAGPSGSGKSTVLAAVAGLATHDAGLVTVGGVVVPGDGCGPVARDVGYLAQESYLLNATLRNNLEYGNDTPVSAAALRQTCRQLALDDLLGGRYDVDSFVGDGGSRLSGGERQRACLVRVLLRAPSVYLLDEPTSCQDEWMASRIRRIVRHELEATTRLVVTHDELLLASADRVLTMRDGTLIPYPPSHATARSNVRVLQERASTDPRTS